MRAAQDQLDGSDAWLTRDTAKSLRLTRISLGVAACVGIVMLSVELPIAPSGAATITSLLGMSIPTASYLVMFLLVSRYLVGVQFLFVLIGSLHVGFFVAFFGNEAWIEVFWLMILIINFAMYDRKHHMLMWISAAIPAVMLVASVIYLRFLNGITLEKYFAFPNSAKSYAYFALIHVLAMLAAVTAVMVFMRKVYADSEDKLDQERQRSETLLLNILPTPIADRLKAGEHLIADHFDDATVMFADIVGFTQLAEKIPPAELVAILNDIFTEFDYLADEHGLEKIKTIGDAYMAVGGVPTPSADHTVAVAQAALRMQRTIAERKLPGGERLQLRIGVHTGPLVAGVIGRRKFIYDLWGDTVNVAARMESHGRPGEVMVTEASFDKLKERYRLEPLGNMDVKGKGSMKTYLLKEPLG